MRLVNLKPILAIAALSGVAVLISCNENEDDPVAEAEELCITINGEHYDIASAIASTPSTLPTAA